MCRSFNRAIALQSRFDVGVSPMNADPSGAPTIATKDGEPLDERLLPDGLKLPMPAEGGGWPRVRLKPKDDWRQVGPTPILLDAPAAARALWISERAFHCLRKRADFPRNATVVLGPRCVRFRVEVLQLFVQALASAPQCELRTVRRGQRSGRERGMGAGAIGVRTEFKMERTGDHSRE